MPLKLHFISGLPRAGTTLLAALLRQNPRFRASIESPLGAVYSQIITTLSKHEAGSFASEARRVAMLRAVAEAYYGDVPDGSVVFDNSRGWTSHLAGLQRLYPQARVLCCVRKPAWILDSIERQVRNNPFAASGLFSREAGSDIYARAEKMANAMVGVPLRGLREAWFGEQAGMLVAIRYDSLCARPRAVMREIYSRLGEPWFEHNFEAVEYSAPAFDEHLGLPGLHTVSGPVAVRTRETLLPPDLFEANAECFWDGANPRGVVLL